MAKQSERKHERAGRADSRGGARARKQVDRADSREGTHEHKQTDRPDSREGTHEHKQTDRPDSREGAREYKQVERAKAQERTRDALIAAASDEFFEGNWLKSSLDSLSSKAGVTRQTLLRHFGSKDGLLIQALMRSATQVRDQRWSTPTTDISGAVENVLDHYEEWGERSVHIGAWQRGPTGLALFANAARQIHYEWVEYAFAQWLEPLDEQTRARRRAILIVLCDVQTWWVLSNDVGLPRKEIHAILCEQIEHALEE
jgi:AcrR family transcriptional regulator